mmetsp:Transcript_2913/g.5382  ORF Transcript_2913/g.5382 Transcript_2913/m.5382 type:complete len:216 (-) Transcript_2913:604-1251(-)
MDDRGYGSRAKPPRRMDPPLPNQASSSSPSLLLLRAEHPQGRPRRRHGRPARRTGSRPRSRPRRGRAGGRVAGTTRGARDDPPSRAGHDGQSRGGGRNAAGPLREGVGGRRGRVRNGENILGKGEERIGGQGRRGEGGGAACVSKGGDGEGGRREEGGANEAPIGEEGGTSETSIGGGVQAEVGRGGRGVRGVVAGRASNGGDGVVVCRKGGVVQ